MINYLREEFINIMNKEKYSCYILSSRNYFRMTQQEFHLLSKLYKLNKKELKCHFDEFVRAIFYIVDFDSKYYTKYKKNRSKFVRKEHHKKKEFSDVDILKSEWRKKKKYKDSRSKKNHFDYDEYIRDQNYRSLRRWSKQRLSQGDYDLERKWKKYKHFNTEWLW